MTHAEVLKILQRIRYSPRAGRPVSLAYIARQAGYSSRHVLHDAIARGSITPDMTRRLSTVLAQLFRSDQGHNSPTLGRLGDDDAVGRGHPRRAKVPAPAPPGVRPRTLS